MILETRLLCRLSCPVPNSSLGRVPNHTISVGSPIPHVTWPLPSSDIPDIITRLPSPTSNKTLRSTLRRTELRCGAGSSIPLQMGPRQSLRPGFILGDVPKRGYRNLMIRIPYTKLFSRLGLLFFH